MTKKNDLYINLERMNYLFPRILRRIFLEGEKKAPHHDVSIARQRLLWVLSSYGDMGMKDLAHWVSVTMPTMTEVVDAMVQEGYAERFSDAKDRRRVLIRITSRGKGVVWDCTRHREKRFQEIFKKLKPLDRKNLVHALEAMDSILSSLESQKEF